MTIVPTPIVDEDSGKREIVDVDKKSKKRLNKDGTEKGKPRVLITIIMGVIAVAWLFPLVGLLVTAGLGYVVIGVGVLIRERCGAECLLR